MKTPIQRYSLPQLTNSASDSTQSLVIGYYKCDEGASTTLQDSGPNGADLSIGTMPGQYASLITNSGNTGARNFNGTTHYARSADIGSIYERDGVFSHHAKHIKIGNYYYVPNLTIDAWVFPDITFAGSGTIATIGGNLTAGSGNCLLALRRNGVNAEVYYGYNTTTRTITTTIPIPTSSKCYVQAAIGDASDGYMDHCNIHIRVWQRGTSTGETSQFTLSGEGVWENEPRPNITDRFTYLTVGGMYNGTALFDGKIQCVRFSEGFLPKSNGEFQTLRGSASWDENLLYRDGNYTAHLKVFCENSEGDFVDLTDLAGGDYLVGARWGDTIDTLVTSATITLARQNGEHNLSPEDAYSLLNLDSSFIFDPLLELNRKISIKVAVLPNGKTPDPSHYIQVWDGVITEIEFGTPTISIIARDPGSVLERRWFEAEYIIGLLDYSTTYWDATSSNRLRVNSPNNFDINDVFFVLNTQVAGDTIRYVHSVGEDYVRAANTSASEASGPCTPVSPATQEADRLLRIMGLPTILQVRNDPDWFITGYKQEVGPLLGAMDSIAAEVGDNIRYIWSDYHQAHNLEWYRPNRDNTPMATIEADQIIEFTRASTRIDDIRNVAEVSFGDREDTTDLGLQRPLNSYIATDNNSIDRYGRMWCSIHNAQHIDTPVEAQTLADAIVNDLAEPEISYTCKLMYRRTVELGDVYTFRGNGIQFSEDTVLAVSGIEHEFSGGAATTTLQLRGKPAGRNKYWFRRFVSQERAKKPQVYIAPLHNFQAAYNSINSTVYVSWDNSIQYGGQAANDVYIHATYIQQEADNPTNGTLKTVVPFTQGGVTLNYTASDNIYFTAYAADKFGNRSSYSQAYVDTTVEAKAVVFGSGVPYRNNVTYNVDTLLLNENTAAVTEYIDNANIFNKAAANGRFTLPYTGKYEVNVQLNITDHPTNLQSYLRASMRHYNGGGGLLNSYDSLTWRLSNTGSTAASYTATFTGSATDYLQLYIRTQGTAGSFTIDVSYAVVDLELTTS